MSSSLFVHSTIAVEEVEYPERSHALEESPILAEDAMLRRLDRFLGILICCKIVQIRDSAPGPPAPNLRAHVCDLSYQLAGAQRIL